MVLLGACSRQADAPPDDSAAAQAAANAAALPADEARAMADEAAAEAARIDGYRKQLLPLLAGTYRGTCSGPAGAGPLSISGAGVVEANGKRYALMQPDSMLNLTRSIEGGKPVGAQAVAGASTPAWSVTLASGREESLTLADGASGMRCEKVAETAALRGKALYPAAAQFFVAGARTLTCVTLGAAAATGSTPVTPSANGVSAGSHAFSFDKGLISETLGFEPGSRGLTYGADYEDGAKLVMALDRHGKLEQLIVASRQLNLQCSAPPAA